MNAHHRHDSDPEDEVVVEVQRSLLVSAVGGTDRLSAEVVPRRGWVEHTQIEVVERALTQVLQLLRRVVVPTATE